MNDDILKSYAYDLVLTSCSIMETTIHQNYAQRQQAVTFLSRWLLLMDPHDRVCYNECPDKQVWMLAHLYTVYEREQSDLLFMYAACRNIHGLNKTSVPFDQLGDTSNLTRSELREKTLRFIFDHLWRTFCHCCSTTKLDHVQSWMNVYTFISKYYPSDKVLDNILVADIKGQLQLMHLAYFIFVNQKASEGHRFITTIFNSIDWTGEIDCLTCLPEIIERTHRYVQDDASGSSTLIIDVYQWIIWLLRSSTRIPEHPIKLLLRDLNDPDTGISVTMKQFLFDQIMDLLIQSNGHCKSNWDLWDYINLLPMLMECIADQDHLDQYRIPDHPSSQTSSRSANNKVPLFDLYFFYLRSHLTDDMITPKLLNKGMLWKLPKLKNASFLPVAKNLFNQLRNYFLVTGIAVLLCRKEWDNADQQIIDRIFTKIQQDLLNLSSTDTTMNSHLQLFLSTIISKQSWNYLIQLLVSGSLHRLNANWADTLDQILELNQTVPQSHCLNFSQQIQFTLPLTDTTGSLFPDLHQPYQELRKIVHQCTQNNPGEGQWTPLTVCLSTHLNSPTKQCKPEELKALLLLNIYYDYYCTNQLDSIQSMLTAVKTVLPLRSEEQLVFQALTDPEQYIIGYSANTRNNTLNNSFRLDCQDEFEISQRHLLVNLIVMILLGGPQSFLWTFAFQPSALQNTFGKIVFCYSLLKQLL